LMAGGDEAFKDPGYRFPKNLLEIDARPMVQHVIESVQGLLVDGGHLACAVQRDEDQQFHTGDVIRLLEPRTVVVQVPGATQGAACTALLAIEHLDLDDELIVLNGDQVLMADLPAIVDGFRKGGMDAGTLVFDSVHPRWSYVRCGSNGCVAEAAEKRPISRMATAGIYWFRRAADFVDAAMSMIRKDASVDGRFYVCPTFNELILKDRQIGVCALERSQYFSLATPRGVDSYEESLMSRRMA
jgi:dTDP-glucose pyrophosphorylase